MATRGAFIRKAYTEEIGMVYVYQDMDNPNMFFCESTRGSAKRYLPRSRVKFRK